MAYQSSKFLKDRMAGEAGERRVAATIQKIEGAEKVLHLGEGRNYDFRLEFTGRPSETYEVKTDFLASSTGNVFLEYSCNSKLSGLSATEADKWAILLPELKEIVVFCPKKMWAHLQISKYRSVNGGDGWRASGFLISIETLKDLPFTTTITE